MNFENSKKFRDFLLPENPRMMLAFSRGKDALSAWVALRDDGFEVIPVHLFLVPGLEFVEESLRYYERTFGCKIHNLPHPFYIQALDRGVLQPPTHIECVEELNIWRELTHRDIFDAVAEEEGLKEGAIYATGVRAADNLTRRLTIKKNGPLTLKGGKAHVIFDWTNNDVESALRRNNLKLSKEYALFGRTFDGLWSQYLVEIEKAFPGDFRRICEFFPLAEMVVWNFKNELQKTT